ncbi:WD40 domain protein (macronuclear) [Tetrahymena thermophila SB210]|uniref:WD40 domain protein n=1 Tax=Tetrahymena thermophila (strain SB210) TaxID=312017 RepID=Q23DD1_TETTS|nr:WD40 domain protein [Tetrahymena thermophila SB210]EAR94338.1 WD40 domain protein [Tetrahymena thermophila SB210]|eukprot:XP_001014755.1 WD40 domain protein [Tetrahymena thermophila SB210]
MNSRPPQNNQQRKSIDQNYAKAVKEYIVSKIDRTGSLTLSETTGKSNSKRGSIDGGPSQMTHSANNGSRRSSRSEKNTDLPPAKLIDNFLSSSMKNQKADLEKLSNITNPTETQEDMSTISIKQTDLLNNNQEQQTNLFPDKHIYEKCSFQIGEENKIYCLRYDFDDYFVAVASQDGCVRILFENKGTLAYNLQDFTEKPQPATCVRWCPNQSTIKHGLLATYSNGKCLFWHATSSQVLSRYEEAGNDINTCDFTPDGKHFITGGSDSKVRLYDIGKKNHTVFTSGHCPEHKNRIFASKFMDENSLLTAGWDQSVLIWDTRTKSSQGYIYGPLVCGDALDFKNNTVLTGSWRNEKQLQLWDIRKTNRSTDIVWENHSDDPSHQSFIYSCQFSKTDSNYIMAGSTGTYELRLFDRQNNNRCIDALTENITKGIFSLDWANQKSKVTYGTSDGRWAYGEVY